MCVAPVAAVGVYLVGAEDFAGIEVDYGDGGFVDEGEYSFASVVGTDAEMVHSACSAQAHLAVVADMVVAEAEVAFAGSWGVCFRVSTVCVSWGGVVIAAVGRCSL